MELVKTPHRVTIDLPQEMNENYIREALAAILYFNGKLSEKEARVMIHKTRRQFEEEIIPKFGLSMIGGSKDDINIEKDACLRLS